MLMPVQVRMLRLGDDRKFTQGPQLLRSSAKFAVLWCHSRDFAHYHAALLIYVLCSTHCSNKADLHTAKLTSTHRSNKADLQHPCHVQCQLIASVHAIPSPAEPVCLPAYPPLVPQTPEHFPQCLVCVCTSWGTYSVLICLLALLPIRLEASWGRSCAFFMFPVPSAVLSPSWTISIYWLKKFFWHSWEQKAFLNIVVSLNPGFLINCICKSLSLITWLPAHITK